MGLSLASSTLGVIFYQIKFQCCMYIYILIPQSARLKTKLPNSFTNFLTTSKRLWSLESLLSQCWAKPQNAYKLHNFIMNKHQNVLKCKQTLDIITKTFSNVNKQLTKSKKHKFVQMFCQMFGLMFCSDLCSKRFTCITTFLVKIM